jgi:hypothetical protein
MRWELITKRQNTATRLEYSMRVLRMKILGGGVWRNCKAALGFRN